MTAKAKHTPGPWDAKLIAGGLLVRGADKNVGRPIAQIILGDATDEANARLIVAAPELLAACKMLLDPDKKTVAETFRLAAVAVSKAEGTDPAALLDVIEKSVAKAEDSP